MSTLGQLHILCMLHDFSLHSSLLLVYEGKDAESDRMEANHYDADISNCSTDLNASHDSHHQCSSNDENDGGIGHEDETNMDHCLITEDDDPNGRDSGNCDDNESTTSKRDSKFLNMPKLRAVSPHSMDSWLNYSNSSDEYSNQDMMIRKGTNIHEDEATQDTDDVDVYDKINFVNAKSMTSYKKSKIDGASCADTANAHNSNPFQFSACSKAVESVDNVSKLAHETDDGIEVELEEEEDDDQLSSLSSNIDTIIVSDNGETKFYNSSGEQEEHPSIKKKKSTTGEEENLPLSSVNVYPKTPSPLVDVRIIDFAHTTFTSNNSAELSPNHSSKTVHHGPDNGFLMGIESLKRILSEIIVESI